MLPLLYLLASLADPTPSPAPQAPAPKAPEPPRPALAVPYPHPLITEVLYAVPTSDAGDANKDSARDATGDEFVEIVNPHDRPIELRGYTLTDSSANPKTRLQFTFPALTLQPKSVVVLFNGSKAKIPGPVGDPKAAPLNVNDNFSKARVFTMKLASSRMGFSNSADACILKSPDGKTIQRIRWGKADDKAGGTTFLLDETAPTTTKGSVERDSVFKDASWSVTTDKSTDLFTPGAFTFPAPESAKP